MNNYAMNKMRIYALRRRKNTKITKKYTERWQNKAEKTGFLHPKRSCVFNEYSLDAIKIFCTKIYKINVKTLALAVILGWRRLYTVLYY